MIPIRYKPNILVTGTPGCGKSTACELLSRRLQDYAYYNISDFAKAHNCYDGYDESRKSHIVDEEKLLDELEPLLRKGGSIVDWHVNDVFPERLIDLVVVLRCDNSILYDRLKARGYHESKIEENMDAEIMGVVLQDALDSYAQEVVVELQSDSTAQMDGNVDRIVSWQENWLSQHKNGVTNELDGSYVASDENESNDELESTHDSSQTSDDNDEDDENE